MVSSQATSGRDRRSPANDWRHHHRLRHHRGVVAAVERQVGAGAVVLEAVVQVARGQLARELPGIGIEQELVGIEAVSVLRLVRPVHAIAVKLPGADAGDMPVPDIAGSLRQRDALELAARRRTGTARPSPHARRTRRSSFRCRIDRLRRAVAAFQRRDACLALRNQIDRRQRRNDEAQLVATLTRGRVTRPALPALLPP